MSKIKLTQKSVEEVVCPPDKKDMLLFDRDLPGFGLRVGRGGSKIFIAQYTVASGKRRLPIGAFGLLTVEEARKRARAALGAVADGRDPFAERQAIADAKKAEIAAAKVQVAEEAYTFGQMVEGWRAARDGERRPTYIYTATLNLKKHFKDWLDRPASSITPAEVVRALDRVKAGSPIAANRALSYARAVYSWAEKRQAIVGNPFRGIEAPGREHSRERVLTGDELGAIWRAAAFLPEPYGAFVRVLMLTLARRNEVANMRWSELDNPNDPKLWTLPGERSKNHKSHVVHLTEPARLALKDVKRLQGCDFVFASPAGKPLCAFSNAKDRLDEIIAVEREKAGIEPATLPGWVAHDFRRSGVTHLADLGFPPHVADRLLNHVAGSIHGVAAVYQRSQFLPERRAALDAWAALVIRAAEGKAPADNVVILPSRAANQ